MTEVPRIKKLEVVGPLSLRAIFKDGTEVDADLSGLCARSRHFKVFRDDPEAFAQAHLIHNGSGIAWPNGLDYGADALLSLALWQQEMSGREFKAWQRRVQLSNNEAADLLGVSLTTVKNYHGRDVVPAAVKIACDAFEHNPTLLYGRFKVRERGRPKAKVA
ncbi:MAG TPA: DUF2442 domain-containing protein [Alphaproteobacteria bacterium]|jgi:hypothetical protein|nr:DUF2442 domain-containing protein [Alphaproteobacteria bacterium]MDP6269024.1 DUF2442 domain-containing protein [Alphaproteobacteria bacterium]MDP7426837.1 DUF2442 domain-containing protein [Alphaproteobacteria bacterium]HJM48764.1 DUF2442 domain-containing protein [Alphaproteobacteria bacterium]|tara:strand:- start:306 stop:791 length:486 start_codon:yes stop_codon:yes gene_type:complete